MNNLWISVAALAVACVATGARAYLQSPRLVRMPSAPTVECLLYDLLAAFCGLRAWVLYEGRSHAGFSETTVYVLLALTSVMGLAKVLIYARR